MCSGRYACKSLMTFSSAFCLSLLAWSRLVSIPPERAMSPTKGMPPTKSVNENAMMGSYLHRCLHREHFVLFFGPRQHELVSPGKRNTPLPPAINPERADNRLTATLRQLDLPRLLPRAAVVAPFEKGRSVGNWRMVIVIVD